MWSFNLLKSLPSSVAITIEDKDPSSLWMAQLIRSSMVISQSRLRVVQKRFRLSGHWANVILRARRNPSQGPMVLRRPQLPKPLPHYNC